MDSRIKLRQGGASWEGWEFGPHGRAKEWRILAPDGDNFTAGELLEFRRMALDLDYYQVRTKHLEAQAPPPILTRQQRAVLTAALQILLQLDGAAPAVPVRETLQILSK